jgi:hypothetical protein
VRAIWLRICFFLLLGSGDCGLQYVNTTDGCSMFVFFAGSIFHCPQSWYFRGLCRLPSWGRLSRSAIATISGSKWCTYPRAQRFTYYLYRNGLFLALLSNLVCLSYSYVRIGGRSLILVSFYYLCYFFNCRQTTFSLSRSISSPCSSIGYMLSGFVGGFSLYSYKRGWGGTFLWIT